MSAQMERRVVSEPVQMRKAEDGPVLEGYAAVFNSETVIGGWFREVIAPKAFRDAIGKDDVRGLYNHDPNTVLARTKNGTLELSEDERGLRYVMRLNPNDPQAMSIAAKVERGDVDQSSFAFAIEQDEDETWDYSETKSGKLPLRTITRVRPLYDVSAVTYPAYSATSVSARAQELAGAADPADLDRLAQARKRLAERALKGR